MFENYPEQNQVADYDYSDAPAWAVPREWFTDQAYDLCYEILEAADSH